MSGWDSDAIGTVVEPYRHPVKSMLGETCSALPVTAWRLADDRAWAVIDKEMGKIASAKRPMRWRGLLTCPARGLTAECQAGDASKLNSLSVRSAAPATQTSTKASPRSSAGLFASSRCRRE